MADLYQAKQMHLLFLGAENAYGTFTPTEVIDKKLKGLAQTQRGAVTDELWLKHLDGTSPSLGIVPINENSECYWAVIDVDDYDLDFEDLLSRISQTPLVCCKSKSGGAWLFVFSKQPVAAKLMRDYLVSLTSNLGLGGSEIFPKQTKVFTERGDVGNWLNMPYFGPTRVCVRIDHTRNGAGPIHELTLTQFIEYAYQKQVVSSFFQTTTAFNYDASPIEQGPPCLQVLSIKGFPPHTRNTSLLNMGIYLKKSQPEEWKELIKKFNKRFFAEQLSDKEVDVIINSLNKKSYSYQCNTEPLCSFCNAPLCRTRKYGISSASSLPIINSITKILGDNPIWFMDVEGGRLELTTEEFHDFNRFSTKCMSNLNILPMQMKKEQWSAWIQSQLNTVIEVKDETMFIDYDINISFTNFVSNRLGQEKDEVNNNRVWYDKDENMIYFKLESFINYLRFRKLNLPKGILIMFFKKKDSRVGFTKTKERKTYRYYAVPPTAEQLELIEIKQGNKDVL